MDVDVVWQVLFCFTKHDAEDGDQGGGTPAWRRRCGSCATMTHCASPDLTDLHAAERAPGISRPSRLITSKASVSYESCLYTNVLFSTFLLYLS